MKTIKEINKQIDLVSDAIEEGGKYFSMTYEDGVRTALLWVTEDSDEEPMEE